MAAEAATSPRRGGPPRRALLRSRAPVRRKGRCTNSCRSAAAVEAALVVEALAREATAPPRATKREVRVPGPLGLPSEAAVVVAATEAAPTARTRGRRLFE